jgi:hypothetical protein
MAKLKTDYSKTIIYKLVHKNDFNNENIYVGSTTDFARRKYYHSWNCCNEKSKHHHFKVYQIINANGGWSEWNMVQLQKYPCSDKREAESQEEFWRSLLNAGLNTNRAFRTLQEKIEDQKEYIKEYRIQNRTEIYKKQNEKCECGCGGKFTKANKQQHLKTKKHIAYINENKIEELI